MEGRCLAWRDSDMAGYMATSRTDDWATPRAIYDWFVIGGGISTRARLEGKEASTSGGEGTCSSTRLTRGLPSGWRRP